MERGGDEIGKGKGKQQTTINKQESRIKNQETKKEKKNKITERLSNLWVTLLRMGYSPRTPYGECKTNNIENSL